MRWMTTLNYVYIYIPVLTMAQMLHGAGIRYQHLPANLSTCHRFVGKQKPAPFVRIWAQEMMGFFQQQTIGNSSWI